MHSGLDHLLLRNRKMYSLYRHLTLQTQMLHYSFELNTAS